MARDLQVLLDRIRELSSARVETPTKPLLAEIEHTLTDGYACALALEAESWRIQARMAELAGTLESGDQAVELRGLADKLSEARGELAGLRASLEHLRRRADTVRIHTSAS